jgi:hypothetical protein
MYFFYSTLCALQRAQWVRTGDISTIRRYHRYTLVLRNFDNLLRKSWRLSNLHQLLNLVPDSQQFLFVEWPAQNLASIR